MFSFHHRKGSLKKEKKMALSENYCLEEETDMEIGSDEFKMLY